MVRKQGGQTMATASTIPFTAIENSSIARASHIGLAVLGALVVIKSHLNQKTGQCNPSYNTLAKEAGVDRSTMIRYVKRLKAVNLIDPRLSFREDGGYGANHYQFVASRNQPPPPQPEQVAATRQPLPPEEHVAKPPLVVEMPPPGGAPATSPSGNFATSPGGADATALKNKTKERTSEALALPTEKQKTCQHPPSEIAYLTVENLRICHHCFGLLDEGLMLITPETESAAPVAPEHRASAECDPDLSGEPEPEQPPAGNLTTTASETPLNMAFKSCQMPPEREMPGRRTHPLVRIGKWITGAFMGSDDYSKSPGFISSSSSSVGVSGEGKRSGVSGGRGVTGGGGITRRFSSRGYSRQSRRLSHMNLRSKKRTIT
jgi:hypothetical protein